MFRLGGRAIDRSARSVAGSNVLGTIMSSVFAGGSGSICGVITIKIVLVLACPWDNRL